jgi:hypothetical protein
LRQGRWEGIQAGQDSGFQEGRKLGQVTGVNYGMELGFTMGMVEAVQEWMMNQQQQQQPQPQQHDHELKAQQEVIDNNAQNDVQRHIISSDNMFRIEKTVQNLTKAIQEFPTVQDLFPCQPSPIQLDNGDTTTTTTSTSNEDSASCMSQNEVDDIKQKLQRIRAFTKVLAAKLGMPHHSLFAVLQQQQPQPVNHGNSSLMTPTNSNNDDYNDNHHHPKQQFPMDNARDTTDW